MGYQRRLIYLLKNQILFHIKRQLYIFIMTTAARPTFDAARGGTAKGERDLSAMSKQYSSRDLPSHTSLKNRERGQNDPADMLFRDFKSELEDREREASSENTDRKVRGSDRPSSSRTSAQSSSSKRSRLEGPGGSQASTSNLDADEPLDDSDDSDDSDSDDDDTAALMAELQKIKREKADEEQEKEEEKIRMENILSGNPLLKDKYVANAEKTGLKVKRRWDDDVVFKNCSRAESDKKPKEFINDSLRNEFHRKFMDKYIK